MSVFSDIGSLLDAPGSEIPEQAEGDDQEDEPVEETFSEVSQQQAVKKLLASSSRDGGGRGTDANIGLYRRTQQRNGGKSIVVPEAVSVEGTPLKEHRFLITGASLQKSERFSVRSTFGDAPEVAHSFGEQPKIWQFEGILLKGDYGTGWWKALETFYMQRLRSSLLMQNNEFVELRVGSLSMRGYFLNFSTSQSQQNDDAMARFRFSMYVRSFRFAEGFSYEPSSEKFASDRPLIDDTAPEESGDVTVA